MSTRIKGIITTWNDEKGFGFITPNIGDKQVFIHISALKNKNKRPNTKQVVTFTITKDRKGRICATNATLAGDTLKRHKKTATNHISLIFAGTFFLVVIVATILQKLPSVVLGVYLVASLLSYYVYVFDKKSAKKNTSRIPENNLHLLALFGGWPGATLAQQVMRHKSKKRSFRAIFWLTVLLNIALFAWLQTEVGINWLGKLIN